MTKCRIAEAPPELPFSWGRFGPKKLHVSLGPSESIPVTAPRARFKCVKALDRIIIRGPYKKGEVFPYSLPSVGPGADPGVQAVSPQVT